MTSLLDDVTEFNWQQLGVDDVEFAANLFSDRFTWTSALLQANQRRGDDVMVTSTSVTSSCNTGGDEESSGGGGSKSDVARLFKWICRLPLLPNERHLVASCCCQQQVSLLPYLFGLHFLVC